ncbi:MAG: hypothetical protein ACYTFT_16815, partial [Planctomycetota bacterium]
MIAQIPFFPQPTFHVGPLTLHAFGMAVAAAILVGSYLMKRRSKHYGLDPGVAESLLYAIFAGGFI